MPREVDPTVFNMLNEESGSIDFSEIGGLNDQVRELREVIELPLTNPELFIRVGIKAPKGVLLYGPPGTGKTLLARALASNINGTFLKVVASAIVDKYIGESARIIREMFGYAKDHQPCVIFMDEIDAMKKVIELSAVQRERTRKLLEKGVVTQGQVEQHEQQHLELLGRLARMTGELNRSRHDAAERDRQATDADERLRIHEVRIAQLNELIRRASLRSPVSGTVIQLAVLHPGNILSPETPAVTVQPDGQPLRACIEIPNASMRRLRPQLTARLELDAFPHADFGYLRGTILEIDPDATTEGLFRAWLSIDADEFTKSHVAVQVKSGLQLQAQIVVEERDLLSFLLKPLERLGEPMSVAE